MNEVSPQPAWLFLGCGAGDRSLVETDHPGEPRDPGSNSDAELTGIDGPTGAATHCLSSDMAFPKQPARQGMKVRPGILVRNAGSGAPCLPS